MKRRNDWLKKLRKKDFDLRLRPRLNVRELQKKRGVKKKRLKKRDSVLRQKLRLRD